MQKLKQPAVQAASFGQIDRSRNPDTNRLDRLRGCITGQNVGPTQPMRAVRLPTDAAILSKPPFLQCIRANAVDAISLLDKCRLPSEYCKYQQAGWRLLAVTVGA